MGFQVLSIAGQDAIVELSYLSYGSECASISVFRVAAAAIILLPSSRRTSFPPIREKESHACVTHMVLFSIKVFQMLEAILERRPSNSELIILAIDSTFSQFDMSDQLGQVQAAM